MAPSPWAVIKNASIPVDPSFNPAPDPGPWAAIPEQPMESSTTLARNVRGHFGEGPSMVQVAQPMAPEIANTQEQLDKVRYAQTHPWGTPENHPGKLGKLAHVFSEVGNIAGNIVAPNQMALIPGTQLGMKANESRLTGRLNEEEKNAALEREQAAQAGHLEAETPEVHPNAVSTRGLQGAEQGHQEAETQTTLHPLPEYSTTPYLTPEGQQTELEKHTGAITPAGPEGMHYARAVDRFQHVNGTVNGQPTSAFADPLNHQYVDQAGNPIPNFKPMPQPAMLGPVGVTPQGHVIRETPGTTLPAGTMTPSQAGSVYEPTGQEKTAAGRAQIVLKQLPRTIAMIDQNAAQLGPAMGRWNEFMQGKGGFNAPGFAMLRQDLMMMSSAVALAHAVGRLPENLREEFDNAINAPKQTPENLKAVLNDLRPWMSDMANMATPGANQGVDLGFPKVQIPEPARPANVPQGYHFDANGPKGAGWYAPTAKH